MLPGFTAADFFGEKFSSYLLIKVGSVMVNTNSF